MEHLSPTWITAFDQVVHDHAGLREASADRRVVVQFTVADGPGDAVVYALVLDHGENHVVAGAHPEPDITLRTDRRTAAAIASHAESAQTAFMSGRLRLGGDVRVLIANQDLLAGVDDCSRSLRDVTDLAPPQPATTANGAPRA
jgi:hypothetical protein